MEQLQGYCGIRKKPEFLTMDWILSQFAMKKDEAEKAYKKFVHAGIGISSPLEELKGQSILGDKVFEEKLKPVLKDKSALKEITRVDGFALRPSLDDIFISVQEKGKRERNGLIGKAHLEYGYTLTPSSLAPILSHLKLSKMSKSHF